MGTIVNITPIFVPGWMNEMNSEGADVNFFLPSEAAFAGNISMPAEQGSAGDREVMTFAKQEKWPNEAVAREAQI